MSRTITVVLGFDDHNPPHWIWENHKQQIFQYGVMIFAIAEGDRISNISYEDE